MSRIIAGSRGGRRLTMPSGDRTRPTTDRVREALFSAVAAWVGTADGPAEAALAGLAVADLYAGSGAVGLEAASRGADPVLLVEANRRTAQLTKANAADLGLRIQLQATRVEQLAGTLATRPFDVLFLDPPYDLASGAVSTVLATLVGHGWLAADGLVVVERSRRTPDLDWPAPLTETWSRTYGETVLHYATAPEPISPGAPDSGAPGSAGPEPAPTRTRP